MRLSLLRPLVLGLGLLQPILAAVHVPSAPGEERRTDLLVDRSSKEARSPSIWDDIWQDIKNAATCTACDGVLTLLKTVAALGDSFFVFVVTEVCKLSGAEDDDVCTGSIKLEGPIIASALRDMTIGSKTSQVFCITFLGLCPYPDIGAYTVPFPSAANSSAVRPLPSGQDPIYVVHYSDIHIDPFYVSGSNTNCSKPICCRSYTTSDAPGNNASPAGPNGDHQCDAPTTLEESMYAAIKALVPNAAFGLFTGDIIDHAVWNTTEAQNIIDINNSYSHMSQSGALPYVFGTAGNHESSPTNAFPSLALNNNAAQWVYDTLASAWTQWIGLSAASSTVEKMGAYSVKYASSNLRVISLNTNMYYVDNYWLYRKTMETDPNGQLVWLAGELDAAEKAGERVYIIGHMPFGLPDALHDGSNYLDQIVNRYSDTIAAMFFGHTHQDHFQISYSDYASRSASNAKVASYIAPSLTPTSGYPSFRVYAVDPVTFGVLDSITYMADMTDPSFQTTGPVWKQYYSAKEAYGPLVTPPLTDPAAELTAEFWHNVTVVLASNQTAFDEYYARKSRGWNVGSCTGSCVTQEVCGLQAARAQDNCVVPTPGIHFNKRSEEPYAHRDECGVSVARSAIASLATKREMLEHVQGLVDEEERKRKART
ncbi:sphingomyelin phosphodiesterase [Thozetella sp. PMI_491]|nr:sphingomyelin phosphodiesterase [Thozetella sp. PMI_491]